MCDGLGMSLSDLLGLVATRVHRVETLTAPVTLPVGPAAGSREVSASAA